MRECADGSVLGVAAVGLLRRREADARVMTPLVNENDAGLACIDPRFRDYHYRSGQRSTCRQRDFAKDE